MTKTFFTLATVLIVGFAIASGASSTEPESSAKEDSVAIDYETVYEGLTELVGTWDGEGPNGSEVTITYHLTGGGAALVESFFPHEGGQSSMSSVYHLDGDDLMMTHYCGAKNQPRMKAVSYDSEQRLVRFEFLDVTNLSAPEAYHTREAELELTDEDHAIVRFKGLEEGEPFPVQFELTRQPD